MIPDIASPIVRQILAAKSAAHGGDPVVLDVGCSYGVNAAVHRFPLSFADLRHRYSRKEMAALSPKEVARLDRNFFASWPDTSQGSFVGLDISEPAIRYAEQVGLIDQGIVANLEADALKPEHADIVRECDVILSTGAVGYVSEKTYSKLLDAMGRTPWIISFVLRMFPFNGFESAFEERGLVTEKLSGATFVQRRFRDSDEFRRTLNALSAIDVDTEGFESEGLLQAELFLSRPKADALAAPLDQIVTVASGRWRPVNERYVRIESQDGPRITVES